MRKYLLLVLLLMSSPALAAGPHVVGPQACQGNCPNWHNELSDGDSVDGGPITVSNSVVNTNTNQSTSQASSNSNSTSRAEATGGNAVANAVGGVASADGEVSNVINFERSAATAYAAALTASAGTCMGSSSVGGQGVGFGVSIGSTWNDDDCNRRRYSAILQSLGETEAAIQLLCLNKEVKSVLARCRP